MKKAGAEKKKVLRSNSAGAAKKKVLRSSAAPQNGSNSNADATPKIMARSKKMHSSPNPTTLRLVKALKRTQSSKAQRPCPSSSSPESVKRKPISENLQKKLSKKRKRVDPVPPPNNEEGIKLLKRGCVTMHRIVRRKIMGIKVPVSFNAKGEPFGQAAAEMQSYIGVLARTKPPIWHDSWKQVPKDTKNKIWDCVQMAFVVPPSAKKMVLKSACQKWREFKCRLTTHYVLPYRDHREMLKSPPADYSFIEKSHWDIFVADRISDEFLEIHEQQKKRRKTNPYPHRLSRRGYANLEHEWSESHPEMAIDRSTTWVLARKDKAGNFKTEEVQQKAEEIEKMKQRVSEGEVVEEGVDDVLTKVLGNPEHRGRVRGQGSHVKQSVYFNLPRQRKATSIDDRIREGVQKFLAEEASKIIQERDAFWAAEMEKLKAQLIAKNVGSRASPNIVSQQGSCSNSKGGPAIVKEFDVQVTVKKRLDLENDIALVQEKKTEEVVDVNKCEVVVEVEKCEEVVEVEKCEEVVEVENKSEEVGLAIGSLSNIVAYATIDEVAAVEGRGQTLHGALLAEENARVSITRSIQGDVKIPFPIQDEIMTVKQAVGTYIAWPRDLIVGGKISIPPVKCTPKRAKKIAAKKSKKVIKEPGDSEHEFVVEMDGNYPSALKRLWMWAKDALCDGRTICFQLCQEAFGLTKKQHVFLQDVHALCSRGEMSGSIICIFIHCLEEYLKKHKMTDMVAFVDPGMIGVVGCGTAGERSHALASRFKDAKKGQYFLLPYNDVNHWALTVVNPDAEVVYHMDPLKRRIANEEWLEVVDNGIKLYKENMKKVARKKIIWENMAGVPVQTGNKDCGLFVMRYMKEICENKELDFAAKWIRRNNLAYSDDDINEIRTDLAKFFMKHHAC